MFTTAEKNTGNWGKNPEKTTDTDTKTLIYNTDWIHSCQNRVSVRNRLPVPGILQAGLRGVCGPDNPFTSTHEVKDERQWREKKIDQYFKLPTYITLRFTSWGRV
jgi:hypothetical protein